MIPEITIKKTGSPCHGLPDLVTPTRFHIGLYPATILMPPIKSGASFSSTNCHSNGQRPLLLLCRKIGGSDCLLPSESDVNASAISPWLYTLFSSVILLGHKSGAPKESALKRETM